MPVQLVPTSVLLPQIAAFAPTCPAFVAEQQIRMAAIDLAEVSRAWRHVTTLPITGPQNTMVAPPGAAIHEIEFAEFEGQPLRPIQFSTFEEDREGFPQHISQTTPDSIALSPWKAGELRISMFLKPRADNAIGQNPAKPFEDAHNVIPDFFISLHGNTLAQGALALIFGIPDEPWSDPARASYYGAQFREARDRAFRSNMRGQQRAKIRTKFRDF